MSKVSQGKRQRLKQSDTMNQKLFAGMNPKQIITLCKSKRLNIERLIMAGDIPILPLAQHFGLDLTQSTSDLKNMIIDCLENQISISNPSHNIQKRP